jgi:transcriptional regulator with XRE-family HTH domain
MKEIGRTLREARERLGLTLEEVERNTHIRARHLAAIEKGELETLPSSVQARGFLKNYAEFLGLDADALLLQYAETLQERRTRLYPTPAPAEPITRPAIRIQSRRPRWLSADFFLAAGLTLAVIVVLVWGLGRVMAALRERAQSSQAEAGFLIPSATASETATVAMMEVASGTVPVVVAGDTPVPTPLPSLNVPAGVVNVRLLAERSAWVRVIVDGAEAYRGRVLPGALLEYQARNVIEVATGNGAGLRVFYNGQDEGTLGGFGEVVTRLWTLAGAITPTPTQTRTATATPRVTRTPNATSTLRPTPGQ